MHRQSDEPKPLKGTLAFGRRRTLPFVRHSRVGVQGHTHIRRTLATSRRESICQ